MGRLRKGSPHEALGETVDQLTRELERRADECYLTAQIEAAIDAQLALGGADQEHALRQALEELRELEVRALVAEGMRNAQIAERLIVSRKTVDHHVSAILRKLDAPTRSQPAATAIRLGLLQQGE